jgi:Flp pilus assembly protein TadB
MSARGSSQPLPDATEDADYAADNSVEGRHPAAPTQSTPDTRQTLEGRRLTQRISILLGQRTGLSRVMLLVLTAALILGLLGFAVHALWVVVVIIIALALGYVGANSRRDRTDAVNQRQEDELDSARHRLMKRSLSGHRRP